MKKLILLLVALVCLQTLALAVPNSITAGPYKVTFDIGIPRDAYTISVRESKETESLSGENITIHFIQIGSDMEKQRMASVLVTESDVPREIPAQRELVETVKKMFLQTDPKYIVQAAGRTIDGFDGAVASGVVHDGIYRSDENYIAIYYISALDAVSITSSYPWDAGTLSLLKTIHVEKINTTA